MVKNPYFLVFVLVACLAVVLISFSFAHIRFAAEADEGYYLKYASYISGKGLLGFKDLFKEYVRDQKNWLSPSPLRIGFIVLSSLWLKVFGQGLLGLAYLSLLCFCLFLFVSFYFTSKYFDRSTAVLFTVLLAFSPLNMAMARRALTESAFSLLCALSIWIFFANFKGRSRAKLFFFILIYSFSILIKETAVLLSLAFIAFLTLERLVFKKAVRLSDLLSVSLFPLLIVGTVYISLGGLTQTLESIKIILNPPVNNPYASLFGSGPWYRYLIDYMLLSPWVLILSIGYIFYCLSLKERQEIDLYFLTIFIVTLLLFNIFTKNVRYVILLDMVIRLFSLLMLKGLFAKRLSSQKALVLITGIVIVIAGFDYINFYNLFFQAGIYDPASLWLLKAKRLIP